MKMRKMKIESLENDWYHCKVFLNRRLKKQWIEFYIKSLEEVKNNR